MSGDLLRRAAETLRQHAQPILMIVAVIGHVGSIVAANWLTSRYGLVPVGFGMLSTAGTYAAGVAFVARDAVQDLAGKVWVAAAIALGAGLSVILSTPSLAIASAVAFALSELADWAVYTPLRSRGYVKAAVASNVVGTVLDTFVFLTLAGFPITALVVGGQVAGKLWVTSATVAAVGVGRVVLRHRQHRAGA